MGIKSASLIDFTYAACTALQVSCLATWLASSGKTGYWILKSCVLWYFRYLSIFAPVTVLMDWTCHENVQRMHPQACLLQTAGRGEATTRRSAQALQGQTKAEPEDLWNTTNWAQQHLDCLNILMISLPWHHWRLRGHTLAPSRQSNKLTIRPPSGTLWSLQSCLWFLEWSLRSQKNPSMKRSLVYDGSLQSRDGLSFTNQLNFFQPKTFLQIPVFCC